MSNASSGKQPSTSFKKTALITGCSSGFGLITAIEMAKAGYRVFASMRNLSKRANLDAAARSANVDVDVIELDVTKEASVIDAVNKISQQGRIDVLVNNAGIGIDGFAEELSLAEFREIFETNFFGLITVTKAVYPIMREQHSGHIINISSIAGFLGLPNFSAYSASKFAVEGFSECLRYEGLLDGINVSLVEPGTNRTDIRFNNLKFAEKAQDPASPHYTVSKNVTAGFSDFFEKNALNPLCVAQKIVQIANTKKPKLHYVVCSKTEKINLWLHSILPSSLFEKALMAQVFKK